MKIILYIVTITGLFFLSRCAQQMAPSGGERDLYAPILDTNKSNSAVPRNFSTNFSFSEIELSFNEYFTLEDPSKNIIITPIPSQTPTYRVKGKKLIIDLGDELLENTTYTINFGSSIKDLTEGNVVKNFNYVFSTGNFIDSLNFSGRVVDAFSKNGIGDITVMLYDKNSDSIPFTERPLYFVKTTPNGNFNMKYLKSGNYKAIALLDNNNNYKFNPKSEEIAFLDDLISIPKLEMDSSETIFYLFKEASKKQFVSEKKYTYKGKVNWVMNKPSKDLKIKGEEGFNLNKDWVFYSKRRDSIEFWIDTVVGQQKSINISILDKTNDFEDTVKVQITNPKKPISSPFIFTTNAKAGLDIGENFILKFNKPITSADKERIELLEGEANIPITLENIDGKTASIKANWTEGSSYKLTLFPGAFTNMFDETVDTVRVTFNYKEEKDYGKLIITAEVESGTYILELLRDGNVISTELFSGNSFKFDYSQLHPGKYNLRLVFDENADETWNTGDYLLNKQPERVEYYNEEINVRSGWDIDITWKLK